MPKLALKTRIRPANLAGLVRQIPKFSAMPMLFTVLTGVGFLRIMYMVFAGVA